MYRLAWTHKYASCGTTVDGRAKTPPSEVVLRVAEHPDDVLPRV